MAAPFLSRSSGVPRDVAQHHRDREHKTYVHAARSRNTFEAMRHVADVPQDVRYLARRRWAAGRPRAADGALADALEFHEHVLAGLETGLPQTRVLQILQQGVGLAEEFIVLCREVPCVLHGRLDGSAD